MAARNMVKAQFQSGSLSLTQDRTFTSDRPVTTSEACSVFDSLMSEIRGRVSNREVVSQAERNINDIKGRIRSNASNGMTGRGFGQSFMSKSFSVDGQSYRVDFELSGDVKG